MQDIAGWIALAATCAAALMTAANLGARVTGWGFVVFTVGAVAWAAVGIATGQKQLLWSNAFLGLVDLLGIWRWLGRRAHFQDVTTAEQVNSVERDSGELFAASLIDGMAVTGRDGQVLAYAVDALTECGSGRIDYLIVREGGVAGVGETLRRLRWRDASVCDGSIATALDASGLARLPAIEAS